MPPSLAIVIVNWNAGPQLGRCLASIAACRGEVRLERVVVVDNGSSDGSLPTDDAFDLPLTVVRNRLNRGFAAACNQGASAAAADYLLFLNPDTRLLAGALGGPVAFLERRENDRVGIVGIQLLDGDGRVTPTCARFPTPGRFVARMLGLDRALPRLFPAHFMVEWDHHQTRAVDQVMGAFFLIRRSLFEALGGFDERFFVYFEEVDVSVRARALGYETYYLSTAQAQHYGSTRTGKRAPAARLFYSLRSRLLYARKHFTRPAAQGLMLATLLVEPWSRLLAAAVQRSPSDFSDTIKAYGLLWTAVMRGLPVTRPWEGA